ncbi:MAG: aminotransferase class V-fold PLP-dependent enzyme [Candidatus Dormibacteria bacterium]
MQRFLALWHEKGARAWYEDWMEEVARLEALYARTIGADPDEVAFHPSVSSALATVASCLDDPARPEVLMSDLDFPTVGHQFLARERLGTRPVFAPSPDGIHMPVGAFEPLLGPRTALLATLHVYFTTGCIQDLRTLAEMAHGAGALCLGDGYQAVGSMPIDVHDLGVDFYVGGSLKFLCGGPGAAFLYVRRDLHQRLRPTTTGWFSQREQFAFRVTELDYADDAVRFRTGTPPTAAVYAAAAGCEVILEAGLQRIRDRQVELTTRLTEGARELGLELASPTDAEGRGGLVLIRTENPDQVVADLLREGTVIDHRPGKIRVSPHYYNTVEECDLLLEQLSRLVQPVAVAE